MRYRTNTKNRPAGGKVTAQQEEKVDRRVRRTRELLRSALIAMILEKGYERVTVQDIIDRADVGDVKLRAASPTLAVFEHFAGHREVWRAMVGKRGTEVFIRHLHRFLSELIRVQLTTRAPEEETQVPLDAVVEFAVNALVGLGVHWWIENDLPYSPEEMDQLYRQLTEPGIRAGLRPKAPKP
jgi:AcrR family transcriptional regulator